MRHFVPIRHVSVLLATVLWLSACVTVPPGANYPRTPSSALSHPEETAFGARFASQIAEHQGASGFHILTAGVDGLLTRIQMINAAQKTLDLQYFIFRADTTGQLIMDALTHAAARGVVVRVLVDDGDTVAGDEAVLALGTQPGIQVRVFNPFRYRGHNTLRRALEFAGSGGRLDYRMHNKLLAADNAVALIGGRNIGNQYFQLDPESQLADDDVFVAGPLVRALSGTFDEYWNSAMAVPTGALHLPPNHRPRGKPAARIDDVDYSARIASGEPFQSLLDGRLPLNWAQARVLCDSPDKKTADAGEGGHIMAKGVIAAAHQAQHEFLMINPYIVPTQGELAMLADLRMRGVRVGIVTNSLQSSLDLLAYAGYTRSRVPMLKQAVELYEVRAQLGDTRGSGQTRRISRYGTFGLHGKLMVFDHASIFIGSMNFDERSRHLNTEIGLIIDSAQLADETAKRFAAMSQPMNAYRPQLVADSTRVEWVTQENGAAVTYRADPAQHWWRRLAARCLAWLPVRREL